MFSRVEKLYQTAMNKKKTKKKHNISESKVRQKKKKKNAQFRIAEYRNTYHKYLKVTIDFHFLFELSIFA